MTHELTQRANGETALSIAVACLEKIDAQMVGPCSQTAREGLAQIRALQSRPAERK